MRSISAVFVVLAIGCSKSEPPAPVPAPAPHEDRHEPSVAAAKLDLDVTIDGAASTWHRDSFEQVPRMHGSASDGEARDTWSLRELVHKLVGPTARVVAVVGDVRKAIDAAAWDDATRTPIVHVTKRGALKFRWADQAGAWGETEVKDVSKLEIAR